MKELRLSVPTTSYKVPRAQEQGLRAKSEGDWMPASAACVRVRGGVTRCQTSRWWVFSEADDLVSWRPPLDSETCEQCATS